MKVVPYRSGEDVEKILGVRYCAPEFAFLAQVRNQTGYSKRVRTADAIAMSLYPSRGLNLYGFEIKISRSDWLSELRNPSKAEDFYQYCHYWYLCVNGSEIVQSGELPPTWGLIDVGSGKCRVVTEAPFNKDAVPPDIRFIAGALRKAAEIQRISDQSELAAEYRRGHDEGARLAKVQLQHEIDEAARLKKAIDEFEKIAGIRINGWNMGNVAEAVAMLREGAESARMLRRIRGHATHLVEYIDKALSGTKEGA